MVDVQRDLELNVTGPNAAEIMALVFPEHPTLGRGNLKAGKNARGVWTYFEQIHCGEWRPYRGCNEREVATLNALDGGGQLIHKPDEGPPGCMLVYYQFA